MHDILSLLNQLQRLRKHNDTELPTILSSVQTQIIQDAHFLERQILQQEYSSAQNRKNIEQKIIQKLINKSSQEEITQLNKLIDLEKELRLTL